MHIVHVQHPFIPDRGYQENCLTQAQQAAGHNVTIITGTTLPDSRSEGLSDYDPGEYEYEGVQTIRLPVALEMSITEDVYLERLTQTLSKLCPEIVHAHGITRMYQVPVAIHCLRNSVPLVVDDHTDDNNFSADTPKKRAMYAIWKYTALPIISRAADHFLPIQRYSEDFLTNRLDIEDSRTTVLPLGVNTAQFYPDDSGTTETREEIMSSPDNTLVVTSGHLDRNKRLETLVKAAADLAEEGRDIELLVIGPGPTEYLEELQSIVDESELHATFCGFASHDKMVDLYNAADVGVWPGVGVSINEAIGTGLPVVIARKHSTEHLVEHDNGFIFENGNREDLKAKLMRYLDDPYLIDEHSAAATEYARNELSWENIAQDSISIYQEVQSETRT